MARCDIPHARGGVLLLRRLSNRMVLDECPVQPLQASLHPSERLVCMWSLDAILVV